MQKVSVRGADGSRKVLALVRRSGDVCYVCAPARYEEVIRGDEDPIVGFRACDVEEIGQAEARA